MEENKKIELASTNTITQQSDSVESLPEIMANQLLESVTFSKFRLVPATRDKFRMWTGTMTGAIQAYANAPAESGASTVIDEEFTLIKKSVNHLVYYDSFKNTEFKLSISDLHDQGLPPEFSRFVASELGKEGTNLAEDEVWNGNGAQTGDPSTGDGFAALIVANVPGGQQILDATNDPTDSTKIKTVLDNLIATTTDGMVGSKSKFPIYMNQRVNDAWYEYLSGVAATNIPQSSAAKYLNWDIQIIPNLSDRRIVIGNPENMAIGMGVTGDIVDLQVTDQYTLGTGINGARIVGNWGYAAGIATTDFCISEYTA